MPFIVIMQRYKKIFAQLFVVKSVIAIHFFVVFFVIQFIFLLYKLLAENLFPTFQRGFYFYAMIVNNLILIKKGRLYV